MSDTAIIKRFTLDGSDALESHLQKTCDQVLAGVRNLIEPPRLDGLLLGGGYGRGEGGVLRTPDGDRPYNDLEFFVFAQGNAVLVERQYREPLHELGEKLSPDAGLEVEFKVLTLEKLRNSAVTMFYYDLYMGHRWIQGDDRLLADCGQHRESTGIPLHETTRLMMNRCSGLLFAKARLAAEIFSDADADYVGRNLAKAQLAFGDVLLAALGWYDWSCRERHRRLMVMDPPEPWMAELRPHHAAGVEFKLHPVRSTESREVLAARHQALVAAGEKLWLWLESKRLGKPFVSAREYAASPLNPLNRCPETSPLRNRLVNFREFGAAGLVSDRYPRERLLQTLPLLLWEKDALADPGLLRTIQTSLRTDATDLPGIITAYTPIWSKFN